MAMITNDWLTALGGEFHKPYYRQLFEFVKSGQNTAKKHLWTYQAGRPEMLFLLAV